MSWTPSAVVSCPPATRSLLTPQRHVDTKAWAHMGRSTFNSSSPHHHHHNCHHHHHNNNLHLLFTPPRKWQKFTCVMSGSASSSLLLGNTSCGDLLLLPSFQLWIDIFLKLIGVTRGAQHLGLKGCLGGSPASGREKYDEPPSCDETLPRSKCLNGPGSPHERVAGHERLKAGPASIASRQYDSYSISETQCPYSERKVGGWGGISLASRAPARDLSLAGIAATHQRLDHASFPWGDKPRPPLPSTSQ